MMIKRRVNKGNLRKRLYDGEDGNGSLDISQNDQEDEGVAEDGLLELKMQQSLRNRKKGASAEALLKSSTSNQEKKSSKDLSNPTDLSPTALGSQFNSRMDYGLQTDVIPHKNIMEKYINEQLGLLDDEKA